MPLSAKARVEVFVPDLPVPAYQDFLSMLESEFTYTFGGCTIQRGLDGVYLAQSGLPITDRIHVIYTDTPFSITENLERLARYADALRETAFLALQEEAILIAVSAVYHSEAV